MGSSSEDGYIGQQRMGNFFGRCSAGSLDSNGGRKWSSMQDSSLPTGGIVASSETHDSLYRDFSDSKSEDLSCTINLTDNNIVSQIGRDRTHDDRGRTIRVGLRAREEHAEQSSALNFSAALPE